MSTFPKPLHPVPHCLNPLNFKHALLLAYWIYCYPTALRYYFYQACPALYKKTSGISVVKTLAVKAYCNLFLCIPLTIALVSIGLSVLGLSALALPFFSSFIFSWSHWLLGLFIGNFIGILFFLIFGITFSATAGVARGAVSGSIISVTAGVANATVLAVVLGLSPDWSFAQLLMLGNFSVVVWFALFVGTSVAITIGDLIGSIIGIATGVVSGAIAGTVFGIITTAVDRIEVSSLVYATIIGLATTGAFGASMTFASCLIICLVTGLFIGFSIDVVLYQHGIIAEKAFLYGLLATLIVWAGALRCIPIHIGYLLYGALSALPMVPFKRHPIVWDELLVLPLPGTYRYLEKALCLDQTLGLQLLVHTARNPLQSPVVQRVLKKYLSQTKQFMATLYQLLLLPVSEAYVFAPVDANDWKCVPTNQQLLLAELSSQWVDCTSDRTSHLEERFLYGITWLRRDHARTPQSAYYRFLYDIRYDMSNEIESQGSAFNLASYASIYATFAQQPGGVEIEQSFDAIAAFLSYTRTSQLSEADKVAISLPPASEAIRPEIIHVLNRLKQVAHDISTAEKSNSLVVRQGALLRANSTLEALHQKTPSRIISPERRLITQIVRQWSHFVRQSGGEAGAISNSPAYLKNPYIIGTPVTGGALVGREDILKRMADELFANPGYCPSIVLYGHRRMGKSSILRSLSEYLSSPHITVVDFNMQILGHVANTGELLYELAQQIYRALTPTQARQLSAANRNDFINQNPYHALNSFFQHITPVLSGYSFIIAIDEFEKIEEKIEKGQLSESILEFLRGLTQTYPWFSLIFAGLHTLEEMCYSYWHPFFTSIPIRVSFLEADAARQLIRQVNNIAYEEAVVAKIVYLSNGQPYLVQLVGHTLITYFNRGLLSKRASDDLLVFNVDDLQIVLDSPEFYSIGNAYFKGIWLQALTSAVEGQIEILQALALRPMTAEQLAETVGFPLSAVTLALNTLKGHDVVTQKGSTFTYAVELMRRWVVATQL